MGGHAGLIQADEDRLGLHAVDPETEQMGEPAGGEPADGELACGLPPGEWEYPEMPAAGFWREQPLPVGS